MKLSVKEIAIFGMLSAVMISSKKIMEVLPNIHLLGAIIVAMTVVYRKKALIPLYLYVFLDGLLGGFSAWWVPYLYVWTVLWGAVMLIPKNLPQRVLNVLYCIVCALHGLLFGVIYAPAQAVLWNLDFKGTVAWIIAGLPYDLIHGLSNLICGIILIYPLIRLLKYADKIR